MRPLLKLLSLVLPILALGACAEMAENIRLQNEALARQNAAAGNQPVYNQPQGSVSAFTLENRSSVAITEVYVSPSNEGNWGPDILGIGVLPPGNTTGLEVNSGWWDVKLIDEYGNEFVEMGLHFAPQQEHIHTHY